ncbi:hypothetical protein H7Y40_00640 [Pedobacter sp.]|nr:hypothetical protein [Candidatus Saccharibacteria bacterium]
MKGEGSGIGGRGLLIASIVFIFIVGAIFFAISGGLFGGADRRSADTQTTVTDIFVGRSVRMTVNGPIVANENRQSYQIDVGLDSRTLQGFQGYDLTVAASSSLNNNRQAYTQFVYALSRADYGKERRLSDADADDRGVCATGKVYTFEILDNGRSVSQLWAASCSNTKGTLAATSTQVKSIKSLFDLQIPNLRTALGPIDLN